MSGSSRDRRRRRRRKKAVGPQPPRRTILGPCPLGGPGVTWRAPHQSYEQGSIDGINFGGGWPIPLSSVNVSVGDVSSSHIAAAAAEMEDRVADLVADRATGERDRYPPELAQSLAEIREIGAGVGRAQRVDRGDHATVQHGYELFNWHQNSWADSWSDVDVSLVNDGGPSRLWLPQAAPAPEPPAPVEPTKTKRRLDF